MLESIVLMDVQKIINDTDRYESVLLSFKMDYILFQLWIKLQVLEINRCLIWYFNLYFKYLQQNFDGELTSTGPIFLF